jgi:hypothetical protein
MRDRNSELVVGWRRAGFFNALRAMSLEHGGVNLDLRRKDERQRPVDLS